MKFFATSRNQPERVTLQCEDEFSLDKIDFNIRRRTIFIIHGFLADGDSDWIVDMEKAFLEWV